MTVHRLVIALAFAGLAILSAGCTGRCEPPPPPVYEDPVPPYLIVPGDVLRIDRREDSAVRSREVPVDEDGCIDLPRFGKMKAAGRTTVELERAIDEAYRQAGEHEDPQVSVTVVALFYYVDGRVIEPGRKRYVGEITICEAIADAGGFSARAAPERVRLLRATPDGTVQVRVLNVSDMMGGTLDDVVILPNDIIRVPKSVF